MRRWQVRCGRTLLGAAAITAVLTLALAGCGSSAGGQNKSGSAAGSTGPLAQASEPVQALFKASCQSCHGVDLAGRAGPTTNLQHVGSKLTQEQIAAQITNGGGNMPAFGAKLKPDEIAALAAWLAATK